MVASSTEDESDLDVAILKFKVEAYVQMMNWLGGIG